MITRVRTQGIADDAVTVQKLQNVPSGSVLGRIESGSGDVQTLTAPQVSSMVASAAGQLAGMRNKIINGKMEIAQRGTSFAAIANAAYSLDRWQYVGVSTGAVLTASQQGDFPTNEFRTSLRLTVTTADTNIGAGEVVAVQQKIEGYEARDLIERTFTLSFWVRSSKTGTHCVAFGNNGADRSFVAEYTINAANTWEKNQSPYRAG